MTKKNESEDIISLVAQVVASYVSKNTISFSELPIFINQVHRSLTELGSSQSYLHNGRSEPAVPVDNSIHPDYIVCLEDGRQMKLLKRYLRTTYRMTPEQYRERWGLPYNYPMVAPNYSKKRSHLAKDFGLGESRKGRSNSKK